MRREGCLRGKPTNKTRQRGKCKVVGCSWCHHNPATKSLEKTKGRRKENRVEMVELFYQSFNRDVRLESFY